MGRSSLKQKPAPKGILKKEGAPSKPKRSIAFKDGLIADVPKKFSKPHALTTVANDLEQENFRQVWREVSSKKLDYAARILQTFARKFMLCWILTNDRRTELYEELDYITERLQGDLERLEWEKEDMQQEAGLEVQAERESGSAPPEEQSHVAAQLKEIKSMQAELRSLRQDNGRLKSESKALKKENKQLGYDLKEKSPGVEREKHKIANLERNSRQYKANHDQYLPNIKKWQDSIDQITEQQYKCQRQGILYRNACLNILHAARQRYPRKRVLGPIKEIMEEEFIKYHPIPASDEEYEEPSPPPPPPILYRHISAPGVGTNSSDISNDKKKVLKSNTDGKVGLKTKAFDADDDDDEEDINESHRRVSFTKQEVREDASESNGGAETANGRKEKKERRKSHKHSEESSAETENGKTEKKERRKSHKKKHKHKESKGKSKTLDEMSTLSGDSGDNTESETEAELTESARLPTASKAATEFASEETTAATEDPTTAAEETVAATEETTVATEETTAATEETMAATEPVVAAEAAEPETATDSAAEGPTVAAEAAAPGTVPSVAAEGKAAAVAEGPTME